MSNENHEGIIGIQADADRFHRSCANTIYGKGNIDKALEMDEKHNEHDVVQNKVLFAQWPHDREGNLLHVIHEGDLEEDDYASCGKCLKPLIEEV